MYLNLYLILINLIKEVINAKAKEIIKDSINPVI